MKFHKGFWCLFVICNLSFGILHASPKAAYHWNNLHDGVVYAKYSFESAPQERTIIHAFQIDPAKVKLDVILDNSGEGSSAANFAKKSGADIIVNGGFFSLDHKSIGMIVKSGKIVNPMHKTSWWSIFGIKNKKPFISLPRDFEMSPDVGIALQAGPRLVIDGAIPKLKEGVASRTAVGITKDNKVVLAVTEGGFISLKEMAARMKGTSFQGGLNCVNAMALDGGASSQIFAKIKKFELSLQGLSNISNALAVFLK